MGDVTPVTSDQAPSSQIDPAESLPPLGTVGLLRWLWRQLTSMRTALILLFLLALASVPGTVLPQRGVNPLKVTQWIADNPTTGLILDRLGFFDVFGSPWFSAVYLLLFISLIGCVLPRVRVHWRAMTAPPPAAPRNLMRMPFATSFTSDQSPAQVLDTATTALKGWRVRREADSSISAERGYLRETGNLVFHLALIFVLVGIAIGGLFGWKGNVIVREGSGFSDALTQYDAWGGGRLVKPENLPPFSFSLSTFTVDFERGVAQRGAPRVFQADVTYRESPASSVQTARIEVNQPLQIDGVKVFLVGHGYAPHIVVRDRTGRTVFDDTVVFLPQDGNFTSTGVVKVPDASPSLGFNGVFLPTAAIDAVRGPHSLFPAPDDPALFLGAFTGDLGMDAGTPQSVYRLDTSKMTRIGLEPLRVGQEWTLPDGSGTVAFVGIERWASFQIAYDPGKEIALVSVALAILGLLLSLLIRRRRIWVKVLPADGPGSLVEVAGLAKADPGRLPDEVTQVARALGQVQDTSTNDRLDPEENR